jgi:general secretion pathway protein F
MPRFAYKAVDAGGRVIEGEMEAASRQAVVERLKADGHVPIRAETRRGGWLTMPLFAGGARRLDARDVLGFTRELATLLEAGLPLDRALGVFGEMAPSGTLRDAVRRVREKLRQGATLADALEADEAHFPEYAVGMVRAGEAGGALPSVLTRLAQSLERAHALRDEVRTALQYPIIVLVMSGLSVIVLLTAVIPEFKPLFADMGAATPFTTKIVIAASDLFRAYWWSLAIPVLLVALVVERKRADPKWRLARDRLALRLPLIGDLTRKIEAARMSRTLGTLLSNGVPVLSALTMTAGALSNQEFAGAIAELRTRLKKGEGLAEPLRLAGILPPLAVQLVRVGEETGQLEAMLLRLADIYDEEVRRGIKRLLGLLVPAITIGLGGFVAFVVGSMLSAIMSTYSVSF